MNSIVRVGDGDGLYGEQWNLSGDRGVSIVLRDLNPRPQAVLFYRLRPCSHIDRLRSVQVSSIQFETALCSDWIDLEPIAIVSGNNPCSHCSSDSISNRFNFLWSCGHVPSADCCLDIIMADLANRVLFMLICVLNAMIVDQKTASKEDLQTFYSAHA